MINKNIFLGILTTLLVVAILVTGRLIVIHAIRTADDTGVIAGGRPGGSSGGAVIGSSSQARTPSASAIAAAGILTMRTGPSPQRPCGVSPAWEPPVETPATDETPIEPDETPAGEKS